MERRKKHERTCSHCEATFLASRRDAVWCSDRCRIANRRALPRTPNSNGHGPGSAAEVVRPMDEPVPAPKVEPGRARAGLEEWLAEFEELPGGIVAAARVLADEVDADSDNSPLWGRYQTALLALSDHVAEVRARTFDELAPVFAEVQHASDVERWRAQRYRAAEAAGEDPGRWSRLIPAACAAGNHRPHRWPVGTWECLDCSAEVDPPEG